MRALPVVPVFVALLVIVHDSPASAQEAVTTADPSYVVLTLTDVVVVPPLVVDTVFVAQQRHRVGGGIVGLATGALGVGMGLAFALPNAGKDTTKSDFGWVTAGLGVLDIGMAIWVLAIPHHHRESIASSWTVGPLIGYRGRIVPGATFSLLRF